jgi:hypothetical protein
MQIFVCNPAAQNGFRLYTRKKKAVAKDGFFRPVFEV